MGTPATQQSRDLLGGESTLQGSFDMLIREIGHTIEGPITQIINEINSSFNWSKFKATQDFMDDLSSKINERFKDVMPHIEALGQSLLHLAQSMFGKADLARTLFILRTPCSCCVRFPLRKCPRCQQYYQGDQEPPRSDVRIRQLAVRVRTPRPQFNGVPLTASTNTISFMK